MSSRRSKIEKLRDNFYFDEDGKPKIQSYGQFRLGLTAEEIKNYLRVRVGNVKIEKKYKRFAQIAGTNTCATTVCCHCKVYDVLMYRHDVERFADKLIVGESTYRDYWEDDSF